jgi:hypothetical protein
MESTSPGRALVVGTVALALDCGLGEGAGEVWAAAFSAPTHKEARPRQSIKTAVTSLLMGNNVTPIRHVRKQEQRVSCDAEVLALPDVGAHRRFVVRMLPLPPLQVVQVAAERDGRALHRGNGNPIVDGCATLAARRTE